MVIEKMVFITQGGRHFGSFSSRLYKINRKNILLEKSKNRREKKTSRPEVRLFSKAHKKHFQ